MRGKSIGLMMLAAALPGFAGAKTVRLILPGHPWTIQLEGGGFELKGADMNDAGTSSMLRLAGKGKGRERFNLSIYLEVVPGLKDAADCRTFYRRRAEKAEKRSDLPSLKPAKLELSSSGAMARADYFIEKLAGARVHQKNVNAYYRKDDACADVHISAVSYTPADQKIIDGVLKSVEFGTTADNSHPWTTAMIEGAALESREDFPGALKEYQAALASAAKDSGATPTDTAMIHKAIGEVYLAMDDAAKAEPSLIKAGEVLKSDPSNLFNLACASAVLNKLPEAERALRACLAAAGHQGRLDHFLQSARRDPQLANLRARPGFDKILSDAAPSR